MYRGIFRLAIFAIVVIGALLVRGPVMVMVASAVPPSPTTDVTVRAPLWPLPSPVARVRRHIVPHRRLPAGPYYAVLMVLDGARPDYFSVSGIPHIRALMHRGTVFSNAFDGILESETPVGHATIGTGSLPRHNGIIAFGWPDLNDRWISVFNTQAIQSHVLENLMSHTPTLAGQLHRHDRSAVVAAVGSYKYYANDALGGPDSNITMYYSSQSNGTYAPVAVQGHEPPPALLHDKDLILKSSRNLALGVNDHYAMKLATDTFVRTRARVIMLNVPEFDWPLGHVDGANRDPRVVRTLMQGYDHDLGTLEDAYRKAGVLSRTIFVITADHGFAAFDHQLPTSVFTDAVEKAGLTVTHADYHSGVYLWVNDPTRANLAAASLSALQNPGIQAVYFKEEIPGGYNYVRATGPGLFDVPKMEQANQMLLQSFADANSPDIVVALREGYVGTAGGQQSWKGDHGGLDWESQHIPLIMAGPGIRRGVVTGYPARLIDLAPTLLTLLGASYTGMDGTPLAAALSNPPYAARDVAATLGPRLYQTVNALRAEARAERAAGG
ncbi:MAG TPA: alkaline phosphatase family protein [Chloroflexota bacterium]|nr:alkaline phosphatase family protein [Chloroflexota bacterium]